MSPEAKHAVAQVLLANDKGMPERVAKVVKRAHRDSVGVHVDATVEVHDLEPEIVAREPNARLVKEVRMSKPVELLRHQQTLDGACRSRADGGQVVGGCSQLLMHQSKAALYEGLRAQLCHMGSSLAGMALGSRVGSFRAANSRRRCFAPMDHVKWMMRGMQVHIAGVALQVTMPWAPRYGSRC